ncbi:hypothetical protein [Roseburia faecis]|uniref:hypothetical protein n=1 Tax=Roseburia faecis TaxID=301302 RepID=UPI0031B59782
MWYEMTDKKQWKRYAGYALLLFLSYSIGNAAAVVSTMTLQPEKVEKEMKTVAITFDDDVIIGLSQEISYKEAVSMI